MRVVFETTDPALAAETLRDLYGTRRFTAGADLRLRIARGAAGPADLHRVTMGARCEGAGDPGPAVIIGHVLGGSVTCHRGPGAADTYTMGQSFLAEQPGRPISGVVDGADVSLTFLPADLLAQVAGPGVRFTAYHSGVARDHALWADTCRFVTGNPPPEDNPLLAGAAARLLAATALAAIPNTAVTAPSAADRRDAHPASLRRAVAFVDENAHRDIGPAEIAAAAHVSIRTLQMVFRRQLDETPAAYLRRVRLDRARQDLLAGDPANSTVIGVAARWGFQNHSRFTARYRAAYGVTPSETLRS